MRLLHTVSISLILFSCHSKPQQDNIPQKPRVVKAVDLKKYRIKPVENYNQSKQKATTTRARLKEAYDSATDDSKRNAVLIQAEKELINILTNSIIPFWYGTPWDFNGYTDAPGNGTIACGYFVSTTLLHLDFNLNRYTLAQQNPRNEAQSLCIDDSLITLQNVSISDIYKVFEERRLRTGLYFVGLDFHVGYLLKGETNLFFIHSNYIAAQGVTIEPVEESQAFNSTEYFIAPISSNKSLLKKWIQDEPIKIVKDP